jgi:hypothetical protein
VDECKPLINGVWKPKPKLKKTGTFALAAMKFSALSKGKRRGPPLAPTEAFAARPYYTIGPFSAQLKHLRGLR